MVCRYDGKILTKCNIYVTVHKRRGEKMKREKENNDILKKQNEVKRKLIDQYIEYRKKKNFTQEELAGVMGIKRPNISRFETGQCNPTLDMLVKMAECMDLEIRIELTSRREADEDGV